VNSNPFSKLRVQPFLGERLVVVTWESADEFNDAKFYVARSPTGAPDSWEILNATNPVTNGEDFFADNGAPLPSIGTTLYYKVRMVRAGQPTVNSPAIELFSTIPRHEYGIVATHISGEWMQMRLAGGIPAWHCIPLASGALASNVDPGTGMAANAPCGDSYGMQFAGGFAKPIPTRIRIVAAGPVTEADRAENLGTDNKFPVKLRLMAFPRPRRGHMFVCQGDQRFVIGETVEPFLFNGIVPIAWEANAEHLKPDDLRYKFPVEPYPHDPNTYRL